MPPFSVGGDFECLTKNGKMSCWGQEPHWPSYEFKKVAKPQKPQQVLPAGKIVGALSAPGKICAVMEKNLEILCWGLFGELSSQPKQPQKITGLKGTLQGLYATTAWFAVTSEGLFAFGGARTKDSTVAKAVKNAPTDLIGHGGALQETVKPLPHLSVDKKGRLHSFSVADKTGLVKYEGEGPKFGKPVIFLARVSNENCVLLKGGVARCWLGKPEAPYTLVADDGKSELKALRAVASSESQICAINKERRLACGPKNPGAIGYPIKVKALAEVAKEVALTLQGAGTTLCATFKSGAVWCGGRNYEGQLGRGTFASGVEPQPWGPVVF